MTEFKAGIADEKQLELKLGDVFLAEGFKNPRLVVHDGLTYKVINLKKAIVCGTWGTLGDINDYYTVTHIYKELRAD